jgi:hypothetical protein
MSYLIEGNINFYEELQKSIQTDEINDISYCLISNTPLTEYFVTLECIHKFNYLPLFKDIYNHKKKFNNYEKNTIKTSQIRCPYCRNIQNKLLPYHEKINDQVIEKINGINFLKDDNTTTFGNIISLCSSILKSGERKGQPCDNYCVHNYNLCKRHLTIKTKKEENTFSSNI